MARKLLSGIVENFTQDFEAKIVERFRQGRSDKKVGVFPLIAFARKLSKTRSRKLVEDFFKKTAFVGYRNSVVL